MVDYLEEVKKQIAKQFAIDEEMVDDDSYLEEDLKITDLDLEDLCSQLEDKYQITISEKYYKKFKKISDISDYLYENIEVA